MKTSLVTAVILNKNGAGTLPWALDSVVWCNAVLVMDDRSTDNSKTIVEKHDAHWVSSPMHNDFAAQRNAALRYVRTPWVLFLDADEIVSPELARELQAVLPHTQAKGFTVRRIDTFMGKQLYHGETGSIRLLRIARKDAGYWRRPVHEVWEVEGNIQELQNPMFHYAHQSISGFLEKMNRYTDIDARYRKTTGQRFHLFSFFVFPKAKFFQNYVLKLGFLDGFPGLAMAYLMSIYSFVVRVKLYEQSKNR